MNPQPTPELKAFCFAQYYGEIIRTPEGAECAITFNHGIDRSTLGNCYLQLRSLSEIKDVEAIEVAKILMGEPFTHYRQIEVVRNHAVTGWAYITIKHKNVRYRLQIDCTLINFNIIDMEDDITSQSDMKPYACIDYLRAIGIALPIYFKGTHYTVEQLVELGVIKLKES